MGLGLEDLADRGARSLRSRAHDHAFGSRFGYVAKRSRFAMGRILATSCLDIFGPLEKQIGPRCSKGL